MCVHASWLKGCVALGVAYCSDFQPLCYGTPVCHERSSGVPWEIVQFHFISLKTLEN